MNHLQMHQMFLKTEFFYPLVILVIAYCLWEPIFNWLDNKREVNTWQDQVSKD